MVRATPPSPRPVSRAWMGTSAYATQSAVDVVEAAPLPPLPAYTTGRRASCLSYFTSESPTALKGGASAGNQGPSYTTTFRPLCILSQCRLYNGATPYLTVAQSAGAQA